MNLWSIIVKTLPWNIKQYELAVSLVNEWKQNGYIHKTCREMLELDDIVIILFYNILEETESLDSPVQHNPDSSWMFESDFCFINIRATGIGEKFGDLIQASKLLPIIRAKGIHLGPFTSYDFGTIYAVTSTKTISKNVVNHLLWEKGICPDEQLRAFVQATHMLGKCVGFDLEPHVAQFAKPVLEHPEYFRWISLDENHKLRDSLSQERQLCEEPQEEIHNQVNQIVHNCLIREKIKTIESEFGDSPEDYNKKENIYYDLIGELIRKGYWTIPSHTWNGVGIPAYDGYYLKDNYAKFIYLDQFGNDQSQYAYGIVTPYNFYRNVPVNRLCDKSTNLEQNKKVVEYYSNIFLYWRNEFKFDFVRHDSLDHIFDSIDESGNPLTDRITPSILSYCNKKSRSSKKPYIGNLAERMGYEYEQYKNIGFDLLLGNEAMDTISSDFMMNQFKINEELTTYNSNEPKASCVFATDTHDTGNPHMWGQPLVEVAGVDGMRLRQFVSRFMPLGSTCRPKYEVIGAQDLSFGLYHSNIKNQNLNWVGNQYFNQVYHYIEDVFESVRETMHKGILLAHKVDSNYSWWIIRYNNQILVPVISTENGTGTDYLQINLKGIVENIEKIEVHDFYKCEKFEVHDSYDEIKIYNLQHRQCLLYQIQI
ncbi:MAG: hypothetical protein K0R15_1082 [Clostridiales bacterium]|jgi:hypothetical protein|nr:hypothetical protein [Clostridiales bacterium]